MIISYRFIAIKKINGDFTKNSVQQFQPVNGHVFMIIIIADVQQTKKNYIFSTHESYLDFYCY